MLTMRLVLSVVMLGCATGHLVAQQDRESPPTTQERASAQTMGPSSTSGQIEEDDSLRKPVHRTRIVRDWLQPYYGFKDDLAERHGVQFGIDYTALYQKLSDSLGEDHAASGIFRVYGSWDVLGRESGNTGSVVWRFENRHRLGTDVANQFLGFEAGYNGLVAAQFSDFGWGVTNLYWKQRFAQGQFNLAAGKVDVTDYFDVFGMTNPRTSFLNFDFLYPTVPTPDQGLGMAGSAWINDHLYVIAGLADANGSPTVTGFDSFFNTREFFTHVEFGWSSAQDRFIFDNIHVTAWHVDQRVDAQVPESWGLLLSSSWFIDDTWMPFLRAGWSDGEAPLLNKSVSAGVGYFVREYGDLLGFGVAWGEPSAAGLRDQFTSELFYRFQVSPNLAITPDIQMLVHPALNPVDDLIWVFGLRARLAY